MPARLTYLAIASLDGYINDSQGNFDWAAPDEEVHAFVNDLERASGVYLLGRLSYDVMQVWDTLDDESMSAAERDFAAVWRGVDKVVYSTTLKSVNAPRTRLEPVFEADAVRAMKAEATRDIAIGGAQLGAQAFAAGLIDEVRLFLHPVVIGEGTPALPRDQRISLELADERRFTSGVVFLRYHCRP